MSRKTFSPPGSVNSHQLLQVDIVPMFQLCQKQSADDNSHGPFGRSDNSRGGGRVDVTMVAWHARHDSTLFSAALSMPGNKLLSEVDF